MEQIEFGFSYGYTQAIMKIEDLIDGLSQDLKLHRRRFTEKEVKAFLACVLANRHVLQEDPFVFIRCNNNAPGGYECFVEDSHRRRMLEHDSVGRKE